MGYSFTDLGAEGCRRSLNALFVEVLWHCLLWRRHCYRQQTVVVCFCRLPWQCRLCKAGIIKGPIQTLVVLHIGHVEGLIFSHLLLCIVAYFAGNFWTIWVGFPWFRSVPVCPIGCCGLLYQRPLIGPNIFLPLVFHFAVQSVDFLLSQLLLVWLNSFIWNQIGTHIIFHVHLRTWVLFSQSVFPWFCLLCLVGL